MYFGIALLHNIMLVECLSITYTLKMMLKPPL